MSRTVWRHTVLLLGCACVLSALAAPAARAAQAQAASLAGTAQNAAGQAVADITVQLRDLATGQLAGTTTSSATGSFAFTEIAAGNYSIEIVNAAGQIIGTSAAVPVAAGAAVTGVTVTAAGAAAAGGRAAATVSRAVIVTAAAAIAGVAAVVTVVPDASPKQ